MPEPPAEALQKAAAGQPVLIEPRTSNIVGAIIKLRQIEDAYLYTIRLVDPEVIKARQIVTANTNEYRGLEANRRTTQIAFGAALSRPDADHRPVGDLDRHRGGGPAGAADPPADRRGRRGRDRQSRRVRAGAPVRRRRRLARRHVQQDAAAVEVAAQRNPPRQGSRRRAAAVLRGGACRRHGGRHRRRPLWHDHHRQPLGRDDARHSGRASVGQNLSTLLPHVGRVFEIGRKSGRPVYREQVTFYRAGAETDVQRAGHDRGRRRRAGRQVLCRHDRRHHRSRAGAAFVGLGRCRAAHRP